MKKALLLLAVLTTAACVHQPTAQDGGQSSRYGVEQDFYPEVQLDPRTIKDAVPIPEPITAAGNISPYEVNGISYQILPSAIGYKEQGGASWYGLKFHGHQTSNGEIYNIYGMTAAHKTLPIPSYVRVTNLENNISVIVRVNDRGPFHEGRIIDLSYAAAVKLGYADKGTAQVVVEAIDPVAWQAAHGNGNLPQVIAADKVWLQLAAYSDLNLAISVFQDVLGKFNFPMKLESGVDAFHRVKLGPFSESEVAAVIAKLEAAGYPTPARVK